MYIADMFCFGSDQNGVGVNGILGCMGVFVSYGTMLHGIHMPDSVADKAARGRGAFNDYIRHQAGANFNGGNATMICVANGTERMSASDELYDLCRLLGMREFAVFRPFSNVDKGAAIAAVWERQGNGPPELKYRMDKDVVWQEGLGTARGGHYGAFRDDARLSTNTGNWHAARPPNAHGLVHHLVN